MPSDWENRASNTWKKSGILWYFDSHEKCVTKLCNYFGKYVKAVYFITYIIDKFVSYAFTHFCYVKKGD